MVNGKVVIRSINWYVRQNNPDGGQQSLLPKRDLTKIPADHYFIQRSLFFKEVDTRNLCISESGAQERKKIPILVIARFQKRNRQSSQQFRKDIFYEPDISSAQ